MTAGDKGLAPYNRKERVYSVDATLQHYPELYPYYKFIIGPSVSRLDTVTCYISLLNMSDIENRIAQSKAQVFKECNYGDASAALEIGGYTSNNLFAMGLADKSISSLKVPQNLKVILYDGNFNDSLYVEKYLTSAKMRVITADNPCLPSDFNKKTSSVIVVNR